MLMRLILALNTIVVIFGYSGLKFHSYIPSTWEKQWMAGANVDRECETMGQREHLNRAMYSVWQAQVWANQTIVNDRPPQMFEPADVFSKMRLIDDRGRTVDRYIEPLVGILRDPLTMCDNIAMHVGQFSEIENAVQAKRFLVHDFATIDSLPRHAKLILMDLGASTYGGWGADESAVGARWFVERFARNTNVTFDRIIAFEAVQIPPDMVFHKLPRSMIGRFNYVNLPISANPGDRTHPWSILLSVAKPEDYVVVKLDIDAPHVELPLVLQLVNNATFRAVVDEFFFEHHVNVRAMHMHWGMWSSSVRLRHSYDLFRSLRNSGLRAHSWP
jgi:hypothetical protein